LQRQIVFREKLGKKLSPTYYEQLLRQFSFVKKNFLRQEKSHKTLKTIEKGNELDGEV